MENRIITISREFGSGGRTIGKRLRKSWVSRAMTQRSFRKWRRKQVLRRIM